MLLVALFLLLFEAVTRVTLSTAQEAIVADAFEAFSSADIKIQDNQEIRPLLSKVKKNKYFYINNKLTEMFFRSLFLPRVFSQDKRGTPHL